MTDVEPSSKQENQSTVNPVGKKLKHITTKDIPQVRERLRKKQKNLCPICKNPISDPCLDHDHVTGAVRDVLCRNCNRVEGKILHWIRTVRGLNPDLLRNIARYWIRHQENRHGLIHPGKPKRKRRKRNAKS